MNHPSSHKALYSAFDLFPTSKGASTHISHMASSLFEYFDGGLIYTLGSPRHLETEKEGLCEIRRFRTPIPNYLQRATQFSDALSEQIQHMPELQLFHFRDIWSGLAAFTHQRRFKTLFEVNSLPSIELPYRYPEIPQPTLDKIRQLELRCCAQSDRLMTPSQVIKQNLINLGVEQEKISVIPNAANTNPAFESVTLPQQPYILYFGAIQPWQGVDTLIRAFSLLQDLPLKLVIICANRNKFAKKYCSMAEKYGIADRIDWHFQLTKAQLNTYIKHAQLTVAPLQECSRNIDQGCSPLKIFESLACATPVVASDLPVVREIIEDKITGRLVQADRPQSLSRVIRFLLESPEILEEMGKNGRSLIVNRYNWDKIKQQLHTLYSDMVGYERKY